MDRLAWFRQLPERPLTRLAPSPTGALHLGHLLHLIWVLGLSELAGGRMLLRVEDHDRPRCRPEYEAEMIRTLRRLGVGWDEGYTGAQPDAYRQSDTPERYAAALDMLRAQGRLYACACSRAELRARYEARGVTLPPDDELAYDGHCRERGLAEAPGLGLRVRLDEMEVLVDDLRHGPQRQITRGDLLVRDRTGLYTYHLCVVADDLAQGIDWVIRGDDLLPVTGRQLQLRVLLGGTRPLRWAHHPLITDGARKLSKSAGDAAVSARLDAGEAPELLWGDAAQRGGLIATLRAVRTAEFAALVGAALDQQ